MRRHARPACSHVYMCGIFGFIGGKESEVGKKAYLALCDLEYRGYDSWGIATIGKEGILLERAVGKISDRRSSDFAPMKGRMAIGHSRWATHGGVTVENAHPHLSRDERVAVIHNGIIENHRELRAYLANETGVPEDELFLSETDTEVIPHLIALFVSRGENFERAFIETGKMLEGRYAIVAAHAGDDYLMAMRVGSPLVIGKGEDGYYVASDVPAFIDHTRVVAYPDDRVSIRLSASDALLRDVKSGVKVDLEWRTISWDKVSAGKDGHPHYMLKEILEEANALDHAIRQDDDALEEVARLIKGSERAFFIGCGTAAKMAKLGELYMARIAKKLTTTFVGSEFSMYRGFLDKRSIVVAVSQSGETADVLEALESAESSGSRIVSVLNVVGSSIDRMSDRSLYINAGPEIAVASTKAAVAQMAVLILLAHAVAGKIADGKHLLRSLVRELKAWLAGDLARDMRRVAERVRDARDIYIIGRGLSAPIAHEAAIKIQEVSYIHAEGFSGGELKHGPIALITSGTPVIAIVPSDETKRDMLSNITELRARGAFVIGIAPENDRLFDEWVPVPDVGEASPIASLIPIQLLAYHLAVLRGNDPDKPRNLAKSVTVK